MKSLLVRNIHTLVTMDEGGTELRDAAMLVRGNRIEAIGPDDHLLHSEVDEVLDLEGRHVVLPGLVNTHHHFYQHLTRAFPAGQDRELFGWLQSLYPVWARMTPEGVQASAKLCAAELLLSGCTTASDHLYIFPNGARLDDEIEAVAATGLRFHASRGSMSVGETLGGLPPDSVVEDEASILRDSERVIAAFHDPERLSMLRIVLAPCSPFSVSPGLMRDSAALARSHPGVRLHTHLAENRLDVEYSSSTSARHRPSSPNPSTGWVMTCGMRTACGWMNRHAALRGHGHRRCALSLQQHAAGQWTRAGAAHARCRRAVGLGADGAASNDASSLLREARQAMLSARVKDMDAGAMSARAALRIATRGGARVLGRDDIGMLAPGMAADFIAVDIDTPRFAGAQGDPVAALLFCDADRVDYSYINGRCVVDAGRLVTLELTLLVEQVNRLSRAMWD